MQAGLLVLLSCAAPRLVETPLEPAAELAALPSEPPAPAPPFSADPELHRVLQRVAALRGLKPPPRLQLLTLPAHQLAQAALAQVARDWPEPVRRAQALLLWRLGLLPAESDLLALLAPALEAQLEAFYARRAGVPTLFVRSTLAGTARRRALAHELVHALQDHEHALLRRLGDEAESSDRRSALHALAEADALAVVEQLGLASGEELAPSPATPLPAVLLRSLAAPYRDGRERVAEALREGGFAAVDRWLRAPPASTQALLRPASTAAARAPLPELPEPGADWRRSHADVLGEQGLRVVLEEEGAAGAELAARWRADRLTIFEGSQGNALVWEIELAEPHAAAAAEPLLQRGMRRPGSGTSSGTALPGTEWTCAAHSNTGVVATARQQHLLLFASLTPGSQNVSPAAQCATVQEWIFRVRFAPRPGSDEPHRSPRTPPDSRSETVRRARRGAREWP